MEALLFSSVSIAPPPELKCPRTHGLPGFPADAPVILVNGEIRGSSLEDVEQVGPDNINAVEVACWNPESGELPARQGVQLILITTKDLEESTRKEIEEAVESLRRFVALNNELPGSIRDLDIGRGAAERLEYTHADSTWTILTAGPRALTCTASGTDPDLVEVECDTSYALAKLNLREAYEQRSGGGLVLYPTLSSLKRTLALDMARDSWRTIDARGERSVDGLPDEPHRRLLK